MAVRWMSLSFSMSRIEVVRDPAARTGPGTDLNFTIEWGQEKKAFPTFADSKFLFKKYEKVHLISTPEKK